MAHACLQCRERKLKCARDGDYDQPCRRCRRESKRCRLPPVKRKRYDLDYPVSPNNDHQGPTSMSRETSASVSAGRYPQNLSTNNGIGHEYAFPHQQFNYPALPSNPSVSYNDDMLAESGDYMFSLEAAHFWDLMPVTYSETMADLSQAYQNQYFAPAKVSPANLSTEGSSYGSASYDGLASTYSVPQEVAKPIATSHATASRTTVPVSSGPIHITGWRPKTSSNFIRSR
ncbi:uncharacterized protein AB675_4250 [Cyphellophora attinorum]|uniref:Zn(2)-C6 fungal-type domain-containing protein n=1 Tax=Cyphellophora attinorum TaxID=1664694 RepID=A0A0N0NL39_9EURO|nr:uncharacterized protein AB675_4250 [Phialophora attinorum]KPI38589.1 hypothetical protein AB675_4250 [Phialophora attinorum]